MFFFVVLAALCKWMCIRTRGHMHVFLHCYHMCLCPSTATGESLCVPKCGCVQREGTPAPLFQAIKLRQHKDEGEALIFFSFAVIASAIIFDQGRAEEESPES